MGVMFAATVPGVLLMVVVAIVLMALIAWLLPVGASLDEEVRPRSERHRPGPTRTH
jgi:hypothetical protein